MSRLILALLLFAAMVVPVAAQTVAPAPATEDEARLQQIGECWPNCGDGPEVAGGLPYPPCWPANFCGTGSIVYSATHDAGAQWHYWFCPVAGAWKGFGVVVGHQRLTIFPREPRSSRATTAAAFWALNAFVPTTAEEKAADAEMKASMAQYLEWAAPPFIEDSSICAGTSPPQPPPPPPQPLPGTWTVSGLAVFNTARGSLAGYIGGSAPKGALCDCSAPILVGGKAYCTFAGAATAQLVAQCSKAP